MPADLCLAIGNMPTRWNVVPLGEDEFAESRINGSGYRDDYREVIPEVDGDLLAEVCSPCQQILHCQLRFILQARERIADAEAAMKGGSQSL